MMIDAEMYGMTPSAKIDKRDSAPPENMLNMPRMRAGLLLEEAAPARRVDARHRDERADAIDDQRAEQEQQALADLGETRRVAEGSVPDCVRWPACLRHDLTSSKRLPPAASIAARAPLVRRMPLSVTAFSSLPDSMTLARSARSRHEVRGLDQRGEVDHRRLDLVQLARRTSARERLHGGTEADLRQAALQRHLAAFEADLVVAALARALALDAAAAGLALAGGRAAADAQVRDACVPARRLDGVQLHRSCLLDVEQVAGGVIMPRFSGVSFDEHGLVDAAQPQALRATRRCSPAAPYMLFISVTLLGFVGHVFEPTEISSTVLPRLAAMLRRASACFAERIDASRAPR